MFCTHTHTRFFAVLKCSFMRFTVFIFKLFHSSALCSPAKLKISHAELELYFMVAWNKNLRLLYIVKIRKSSHFIFNISNFLHLTLIWHFTYLIINFPVIHEEQRICHTPFTPWEIEFSSPTFEWLRFRHKQGYTTHTHTHMDGTRNVKVVPILICVQESFSGLGNVGKNWSGFEI